MFFVYHLQTYSPKNRAWKKVIDYVEKYKNVLIKDELSLDALKHEMAIRSTALMLNTPR